MQHTYIIMSYTAQTVRFVATRCTGKLEANSTRRRCHLFRWYGVCLVSIAARATSQIETLGVRKAQGIQWCFCWISSTMIVNGYNYRDKSTYSSYGGPIFFVLHQQQMSKWCLQDFPNSEVGLGVQDDSVRICFGRWFNSFSKFAW